MRYHCPFCDYESDSRGSVEGHISGKSDSHHKGKVGRSHRSDIIQDAETTTLTERVATFTGDSPASNQSTQEQIHQLRADLAELDEQLSSRLDNLEATINARPSTDTLRNQAVEAAKDELETVENAKEEALDEFENATDDLRSRLTRESRRAAKDEIDEQNEAVNETLRQMAVMLSTLPTDTKVQCPKCAEYVGFKKERQVTGRVGTNLTCPNCTAVLIDELPPSTDEKDEYI
jgi:DNA repair exonuclease SbcCD ATPase subunit